MNPDLLEPSTQPRATPHRRHSHAEELMLSELNPDQVLDRLDGEQDPIDLTTFGTVREVCPKCQHGQLRLVLRQNAVRTAHLFCNHCASCFDAHYANGAPALTI